MLDVFFISGLWDEGYALSPHIVKSVYVGEDPFGTKIFDTERSEIGQLLYELKYTGDVSKVKDIISLISPFINKTFSGSNIDCVIPVPASKERDFQPVYELSREIAKQLKCYYADNVLCKTNQIEAKGLSDKEAVNHSIIQEKKAKHPINNLLFDDVYDSGTTANACVRALRTDKNIKKIYFVALTRTKR